EFRRVLFRSTPLAFSLAHWAGSGDRIPNIAAAAAPAMSSPMVSARPPKRRGARSAMRAARNARHSRSGTAGGIGAIALATRRECARQARAQHVAAYSRDCFDLRDVEAFRAQREQCLLRLVEAAKGAIERALAVGCRGELVRAGVGRRERVRGVLGTVQRRQRAALAPRAVDEPVVEHANEPGTRARRVGVGRQLFPGAQAGVLEKVLGVVVVARKAACDTV